MTDLDHVLKSRDITLPTKVHIVKAVYSHSAYLTYMQFTSCKMLGCLKQKPELRLLGEIAITSDMAESEEELKRLLMKVKEETEKAA